MNPNDPRRRNLRPRPPWPPGESGNPQGSSRKQRLTAALNKALDEANVEAFVQAGLKLALEGDFRFWSYIFDRVDGKPDQSPDDAAVADIKTLREFLDKRIHIPDADER